jgi:hypothetical protein
MPLPEHPVRMRRRAKRAIRIRLPEPESAREPGWEWVKVLQLER